MFMAHEPHPDDPYRTSNPSRPNLGDDDLRRAARLDNELQVEPELTESPAGGGRITLFAVAIALVLGAVFYGLNNSSMHQASTSSTAQNPAPATAQNTSPPAAPPGMRDVTPRANTGPGTTTGAAPAQTPPPPAPTGPTNSAPASK
jgi:hypothetical protein